VITQTRSKERVQPQRLKLPEKPEMDEKEIDRASPMKNDAHGITQKRPKSHSVGVFLGRSVLCETITRSSVTFLSPIRKICYPIRNFWRCADFEKTRKIGPNRTGKQSGRVVFSPPDCRPYDDSERRSIDVA